MKKVAKPLGDRVLVKERKVEENVISGIFIPESANIEDVKLADVVSVGAGLFTQNGVSIPMSVKEGDVVALPPYHQGNEVKLNGETYLVLRESDLLMVISEVAE